ncbi:MAG TPA: GtrA family protein [Pseudorhizobium sp.]|jgi:putative flippase GtrA|nr:GtrA family protein [Pseudorhizobium sp.]
MTLAFRYVLFAVISTVVNFAVQELAISAAPAQPLMLSIFLGTGAGFVVKYILDKKWIFYDGYTSRASEARKVSLYGMFSIVTTIIFWSFEVAFWTIWGTDLAKYTGGAIGLAIGYASKYALDRKFVFRAEGA